MTGFRVLRLRTVCWVVGVVVVGEVVVAAAIFGYERAVLHTNRGRVTSQTAPAEPWLRLEMPSVSCPAVSKAEDAQLADDDGVIGVEVGDRARAYRISALVDRSHHVVNDLINGTPVSVTYCDISDCARAYTDPTRSVPLDVRIAGLYDGREMVVRLEGEYFLQTSGLPVRPEGRGARLPYGTLPVVRTTWKEWRQLHPNTEVYVGDHGR